MKNMFICGLVLFGAYVVGARYPMIAARLGLA